MYNNSLHGSHSREDTFPCYKKIRREYRLVRDFTFIMPYEVSRAFYLGVLEQTHSQTTETNSLTFLLLLLRRYEVVLESYLVHDITIY